MTMTAADTITMRTRVTAAADRLEEAKEAVAIALEARDEIIVQAVDLGHSESAVARWARLSQPRISDIVSTH